MNNATRHRAAFRRLAAKSAAGEKIRVGFGVIAESIFPFARVFELMREDPFFDPFIIVIPDVHRGRDHAVECYTRARRGLKELFPEAKILESYDPQTDMIADYGSLCDLYAPANPYEVMNPEPYKLKAFAAKNIPIFYANYGTSIAKSDLEAVGLLNYWRIYASTELELAACGDNGHLGGLSRMDRLALVERLPRSRKRIILAPHHTIFKNRNLLTFAQFLRYADFFLELPAIFPEIDFCFRPHPLLIHNLEDDAAFGRAKTAAWLDKMAAWPNVEIQRGGDFLPTFANSDALIHDCGSFIADYLFTGKPCCYMFPENDDLPDQYNQFGHDCLDAHYPARNKDQVLDFIRDVVIEGNDPLKESRQRMFDSMKLDYPRNSEGIVRNIKDEILRANNK